MQHLKSSKNYIIYKNELEKLRKTILHMPHLLFYLPSLFIKGQKSPQTQTSTQQGLRTKPIQNIRGLTKHTTITKPKQSDLYIHCSLSHVLNLRHARNTWLRIGIVTSRNTPPELLTDPPSESHRTTNIHHRLLVIP